MWYMMYIVYGKSVFFLFTTKNDFLKFIFIEKRKGKV